jgi:hypothetical protein
MPEPLETKGPFVRLGETTWVRYDAITVIRERAPSSAEVLLRPTVSGNYSPALKSIFIEAKVDSIIDAVMTASSYGG